MMCLAVADLPAGPEWEYELKFDGCRAIGFKMRGLVHLMSRNGKDFSQRFRTLTRALEALPDDTAIDGEVVALDSTGRPSFNLLQNHASSNYSLVFYVFDLLMLAGAALNARTPRGSPRSPAQQIDANLAEPIRFSETLRASPAALVRAVREQGLEGVIAKRLDSSYESGRRSGAWVKMRVNRGQELVIGGYVPASKNFDSILVGYYENQQLLYAARVRNGFVPASREALFKRFPGLEAASCPFHNLARQQEGKVGGWPPRI